MIRYALAAAVVAAAPLAAQSPLRMSFWGAASQEIVQSRIGGVRERLSGTMLSGEGVLGGERIVLRLRYGQGTLKGEGAIEPRELVEGEVLLGYRAASWLTLWAGPNARAYTAGGADQRWLFWSGRATLRGTLLPGRMQSFVELWKSAGGSVTRPDGAASGRGAEAGLEMRLSGQTLWGRLAYRVEQGLGDGDLRDVVETLAFSIAYVPPR
ncbi:MAG: hypothetical protein Q8Q14_15340 [Gemmatimonadales bacterium]|nr:hypothetical protein [Gemmatimonadales bacterium]